MAIIRFTTPEIKLLVKKVDISDKDVYVTISQGTTGLTLSGADLTMTATDGGTLIELTLTQAQAGTLNINGPASIQVNWMDGDVRYATAIAKDRVLVNLLDEVIE